MPADKPKSSLTLLSPFCPSDSEVDFPRNSQYELRANPCWGSAEVAWSLGGGPKTCNLLYKAWKSAILQIQLGCRLA
ncbi:hypothetical protein I7I50_12007 [Histoplasma capsulatum G186AR]|nr:hypothetical protein I7I50_12007 [Histoplasma capsulatum G186AR]